MEGPRAGADLATAPAAAAIPAAPAATAARAIVQNPVELNESTLDAVVIAKGEVSRATNLTAFLAFLLDDRVDVATNDAVDPCAAHPLGGGLEDILGDATRHFE